MDHSAVRRGRTLGVAVLAALVVVAACSSDDGGLPPPSSTTSVVESTTTLFDFSQVQLAPVEGTTTTTLAEKGTAIIKGVVTVPEGGVPGATVRLERLVLGAVQTRDVVADETGVFEAKELPGGAYRVRAFLPPAVAQVQPVVFRLDAGATEELRLEAEVFEGADVVAVTSPSAPTLGDPVNVRVRVSVKEVDEDGVVRGTPLAGLRVTLVRGRWGPRFQGGTEQVTDEAGQVLFELECRQTGPAGLAVEVQGAEDPFVLQAPDCNERPPSTTTTTAQPTSSSTTSTTRPSSTTSTTGGG